MSEACPICESENSSSRLIENDAFQYGEDGAAIMLPYARPFPVFTCADCKFEWTSSEHEDAGDDAVREFLAVKDRVEELAERWFEETGMMSVVQTDHPHYQEIIKLGRLAGLILLNSLRDKPDHWFKALHEIFEEGPYIPPEDRGNIRAISDHWVKWGQMKGYLR